MFYFYVLGLYIASISTSDKNFSKILEPGRIEWKIDRYFCICNSKQYFLFYSEIIKKNMQT